MRNHVFECRVILIRDAKRVFFRSEISVEKGFEAAAIGVGLHLGVVAAPAEDDGVCSFILPNLDEFVQAGTIGVPFC